jgi:hypothetical protein
MALCDVQSECPEAIGFEALRPLTFAPQRSRTARTGLAGVPRRRRVTKSRLFCNQQVGRRPDDATIVVPVPAATLTLYRGCSSTSARVKATSSRA